MTADMTALPAVTGATAIMADSVDPSLIPGRYTDALAYVDGRFAWTAAQLSRFSRYMKISTTGDPVWAEHARSVDVERFDATPAEAPGYVDARDRFCRNHGHRLDSTVYVNRSNLGAVLDALGHREPRLLVATLDNHPWIPLTLAADIWAVERVRVLPARIWGIQEYAEAGYDVSVIFGTADLTERR